MFGKKSENGSKDAYVKVLGANGCKKCKLVTNNAKEAVSRAGLNYTVGHITDMKVIASYGVMQTPALVVGKKVVSVGKVLTTDEIFTILKGEV